MKIRYSRQYNNIECGPVAALNILKWLGGAWTYKDHIAFIKDKCALSNTPEFQGCNFRDIRKALTHFSGGDIKMSRPKIILKLEQITNHILQGGAIILLYRTGPDSKHFSVIVGQEDGKLLWINHTIAKPQISVTPEELQLIIMSQSHFGDFTTGLFIKKPRLTNP
jgi:hypothetical protein